MSDLRIGLGALSGLLDGWRAAPGHGYAALADRLRLLVLDGRVPAGTLLPSERELATALGVSRATVGAALDALRATGHLETRRGSGSRLRLPDAPPPGRATAGTTVLDLGKAACTASPLLQPAVLRAAERLPTASAGSGYGLEGLPALRDALARRYTERGLPTSADEILVTTGAQSAIALVARTLLARGDRALVETPGYPHAYEALRLAGARLLATPVDTASGWSDDLPTTLRRSAPALAYLMPDFHNPTGRPMPDPLRQRLLDAAADTATVLVIDETTAELDIDRPMRPTPMAALARRSAPVVTIGSASKTVWGGLRIGWIRAPRPIVRALVAARPATDLGTPILEQLVLGELLDDWDAVLADRAADFGVTRDTLGPALRQALPDWSVPHPHGGLSFWIGLPAPVSSQLALAARDRGVLLPAGPWFGIDGAFERFVRVPFTIPLSDQPMLVSRLVSAWGALGSVPARLEDPTPALV